ncbi:MAG TPA: UDP-N-acetylmuramoyl-tripeptide--D-alanyl-D-alanine ligase [Thermoanaerobaculia bacterium]|nr:UDP-N-acetylmuramoyl-tripeptide--D-alanyl-D-alanine ligase [Thermoanaerobaculia bacterium]
MERLFTAEEVARATAASRAAALPPAFSSVSTDTRTLAPGALYVALKGDRFDGHAFLAEAAAKGAVAAVVRKGTPRVWGLPLFEVDDTLSALGALAAFHRSRFSIPVAAVGGSAGKTTTKEMVAAILRTRGPALATEGNFNNEIGVPLTLLKLGREHRAAVVELGMSAPDELRRITAIARPDAAVLTLIAAEHLEFLKDLDGVAEAEGELYRGLLPGSVAVVNADDSRCLAQAERVASGVKKIFFGKSPVADVRLSRVTALGVDGMEICLEGEEWKGGAERGVRGADLQRSRVTIRLGFVGEHNAMNAAAAAATALSLSYTFEEISRGLAAARPYSHRSRLVAGAGGITILDDCYNASPPSMEAALKTLASLRVRESARAIAVLGDMLELGAFEEEAHRGLGRGARGRVDVAAFFGPRSRLSFEEFSSSPSPSSPSAHFTEIEPLLAWLRPRLQPGDTVLVKGSRGMKLERVVDALVTPEGGPS